MMQLDQMTNTELKKYISEHRNDESAFRAALQVLISRSDSSTQLPYPFSLTNPESEVQALLRERINYDK